jgi:hypothetical protein
MGLNYKLNLNDKMIRKINVRNSLLKKERKLVSDIPCNLKNGI